MICTHRRPFLAVVFCFLLATGQLLSAPDTVRLGTADVHALPFHFRAPARGMDSTAQGWSASDWLHRGALLRTTTPGGSQLVGLSGLPAVYTGFHWLGFALTSPTLGLTDGSWINPAFRNQTGVHTQLGGQYLGSGNLGGLVDLSAQWLGSEGSWAGLEAYSAGGGGATVRCRTNYGTLGFWASSARYRFPYQDYLGTRRMRTGADAQNAQLEWRGERRWGAHTLRYGFQGILQDRGLPRSTASSYGTGDRQRDHRLHTGVRWEHQKQNWHWSRGAFGWMDFQAFDARVVALRDSHQTAGMRVEWAGTHPNGHVAWGWSQMAAWGPSHQTLGVWDGFVKGALQGTGRLRPGLAWARWDVRQNSARSPLGNASGGMRWKWAGGPEVQAARHFRWPTLNDLAWIPGGNPLLLPEAGWALEVHGFIPQSKTPKRPCGQWEWQSKAMHLTQSIVWKPIGVQWVPVNAGSWSQWWNRLRWTAQLREWMGWAEVQYTLSNAAFAVPWRGNAGVAYRKGAWTSGAEYTAQAASQQTPQWFTGRLWGGWQSGLWSVQLNVQNALPGTVEYLPYYPNPHWYTVINLNYKFK